MTNTQQQDIAVDISPEQKVRIELVRRGWKTAGLAGRIGLASKTVTNVLSGKRHLSARRAIEDIFEKPFWNTPQEFAARQRRAAKQIEKQKS